MAKKPNDDLFEGTTMSFGEHLEELRVSLFRAVMGIAAGCLIGFFIANGVVRFFQMPLERAMERYYLDKALSDLVVKFKEVPVEVKRIILDEGLIPEPMQIEAGQLADTLRLNYPEKFEALDVPSSWYTEGDFLKDGAKLLIDALDGAGKGKGTSAQKRVWETLSAKERATVAALAKAGAPPDRKQESELLAVLNALADRRELYSAEELAGLTGPDSDRSIAIGLTNQENLLQLIYASRH